MQLSFATITLREMFLDPGPNDWPSPQHRADMMQQIADLMAADSLLELPLGLPDLESVDVTGFEVGTGTCVVLQCRVDHVEIRRTQGSKPSWRQINRILIDGWRDGCL